MIPSLQRFYGGDPQRWGHLPLPLLQSYAVMLPRLEARESLRRAAEISLGSGVLKKDAARTLSRQWRRASDPRRRARKAGSRELSSLPMKVTRVPVKEKS